MNGSILMRWFAAGGSVWAASPALAQEGARQPQQLQDPSFAMALPIILLVSVVPIVIVAIINYSEYRQNRERLAAVERLVTAGHAVPPELMVPGEPRVTLAQEQRRDVRLGITLLCWALAVALAFYLITGEPRWASWGLLFLIPGLGSFVKARLTGRELARGAPNGAR
jgi:hypothetical protein